MDDNNTIRINTFLMEFLASKRIKPILNKVYFAKVEFLETSFKDLYLHLLTQREISKL